MYKVTLLTVCILLSAISNTLIADEIHQWTDESGHLHYGDSAHAPENSKVIDPPEVNVVVGPQFMGSVGASNVLWLHKMDAQMRRNIKYSNAINSSPK